MAQAVGELGGSGAVALAGFDREVHAPAGEITTGALAEEAAEACCER